MDLPGIILLVAETLVLWEASARIGCAAASWLPRVPAGAAARAGLGLLLGWSGWGLCLLGLAATGLAFPGVVVLSGAALLAGSGTARDRRVLLLDAARSLPVPARVAAAFALAWLLPRLLVVPSNVDVLWYELGAPAQFLLSHRLLIDHVPNPFHLPMPVNLVFGVGPALGDERLAEAVSISFFLAVGLLAAGLTARGAAREEGAAAGFGGPAAIAILFALSLKSVAFGLAVPKCDLAAGALAVGGLALSRAGYLAAGALVGGCAIAAKPVVAPLVAAWYLLNPPSRRRARAVLLLVAGPVAAWAVKTWLATGNPFYPVLWEVFPSFGWGPRNEAANLAYHRPLCLPDALHALTFPRGLLSGLWAESPLLVAAIPVLLVRRPSWRAGWAGLLGAALTLALGKMPRFGLAAGWWLAYLAAAEFSPRLFGRRWIAPAAAAVLAAAVVARFAIDPAVPPVSWRLLGVAPAAQRAAAWGAWGRVTDDLGSAPAGRVAVFGDLRVLGLPGRLISTGGIGETPLAWKISSEEMDPAGVRKRFRELGIVWVVHNFVGAAYRGNASLPFPWSDGQLLVYRAFVRRHLRVAFVPEKVDHVEGGFYVYRVLDAPEPGPRLVYDLPGAEGLLAPAEDLARKGKSEEAAREVARLGRLLPDVGHLRNVMGYSFRSAGRWDGAFRMYAPGIRAGMIDDENWLGFAMAAEETNRIDEAIVAGRRALVLYPGRRPEIEQLLAAAEHKAGERALNAGKPAEAEAAYRACLASLRELPRSPGLDESRVFATVRLADAIARQGRRREAQEVLNEAALIREDALLTREAQEVLRRIGAAPSGEGGER